MTWTQGVVALYLLVWVWVAGVSCVVAATW